jgi:hypothetical protein
MWPRPSRVEVPGFKNQLVVVVLDQSFGRMPSKGSTFAEPMPKLGLNSGATMPLILAGLRIDAEAYG